jgi:hypothetical protein
MIFLHFSYALAQLLRLLVCYNFILFSSLFFGFVKLNLIGYSCQFYYEWKKFLHEQHARKETTHYLESGN